MQIRCARDSLRSRKARRFVQIQTAQYSDRRLQASSEFRSSGFRERAEKQEPRGIDSELAECAEDPEKEGKLHPYFASPVTGRHAGLGEQ